MSTFSITKELLNGYFQAGYTTKEMAEAITRASGYPCSVGTVKKACAAYGLNLQRKPQKSPFRFGDSATPVASYTPSTEARTTEGTTEELNVDANVRF